MASFNDTIRTDTLSAAACASETFSPGDHLALESQLDLLFVKIDPGSPVERQVTIRRTR